MLHLRLATHADLPRIDEIFNEARKFMQSYGNFAQWANGYPNSEVFIPAIAEGKGYVCYDDSTTDNTVVGMFMIAHDEPVYDSPTCKWHGNEDYIVVHRLAALPGTGAGQYILNTLKLHYHNIRIDTHEYNKPMLHILDKLGFEPTGSVFYDCRNGGTRLTFDYVAPDEL